MKAEDAFRVALASEVVVDADGNDFVFFGEEGNVAGAGCGGRDVDVDNDYPYEERNEQSYECHDYLRRWYRSL